VALVTAAPAPALLELAGVAKTFGAVEALRGVDLAVSAGEVLAICGDNGAGKSTLIKIASGAELPTAGEIRVAGAPVRFASPADALAKGVATIYQDLALAPRLAIHENVFMGAELTRRLLPGLRILDKRAMRRAAAGYLARLKVDIPDLDAPVGSLSGGQRQAVAIARALRHRARLVIFDEPTAALGVRETAEVLGLIRQLKGAGVGVIVVSHNMHDVLAVADRVAILKQGRKIFDIPAAGLTPDRLGRAVALGTLD
jgi:simple sugar transport system ATP-binding protein